MSSWPAGTSSVPGRTPRCWSHLYEDDGERMLQRLRGMFAFAVWDRRRRRLLVARDHFGQKPLFYTERDGRLTFASEIKALLAHDPGLADALAIRAGPVSHPPVRAAAGHVLRDIRALPPAHFLVREAGGPGSSATGT